MKIDPSNPVVHQSIKRYLTKDTFGDETFYDYDKCDYVLSRTDDAPDLLKFGFSCNCFKQIMENGGQVMIDTLYKDHILPADQALPQSEITLGIDAGKMGKTESK